jgi:hypothetical protein
VFGSLGGAGGVFGSAGGAGGVFGSAGVAGGVFGSLGVVGGVPLVAAGVLPFIPLVPPTKDGSGGASLVPSGVGEVVDGSLEVFGALGAPGAAGIAPGAAGGLPYSGMLPAPSSSAADEQCNAPSRIPTFNTDNERDDTMDMGLNLRSKTQARAYGGRSPNTREARRAIEP